MTTITFDDSELELASDSASSKSSSESESVSDLDSSSTGIPEAVPVGKNWNFPKMHLNAHIFEDIVQKGVTRNYNTKPNESMHRSLKDNYHTRTNFKNVVDQVGINHWHHN